MEIIIILGKILKHLNYLKCYMHKACSVTEHFICSLRQLFYLYLMTLNLSHCLTICPPKQITVFHINNVSSLYDKFFPRDGNQISSYIMLSLCESLGIKCPKHKH